VHKNSTAATGRIIPNVYGHGRYGHNLQDVMLFTE